MTYGLTDAGFTAARQADYLLAFQQSFEASLVALGLTVMPDWERDLLYSQVGEFVSYSLGQLSEANQAVYDARSEGNATGLQLANLCLVAGIERQEATQGTVTLRCHGTDGTIITQGKSVEADDHRWTCTEDGTIGDVVTGYVDLVFECEDEGEIVALAGTIDTLTGDGQIVSTIAGWDDIEQIADADPGQDRETDGELRTRKRRALQAAGGGSTNAIRASLLDLDFVTGCTVIDNKTISTVVTDGISLRPVSVACVVAPDSMTADQITTVVETIYDKILAGTDTSGDETATITKGDGRSETIRYSFAVDTAVNIAYTLVLEAGYVLADVSDALEALVDDLFLTMTAGSTVYPLPFWTIADQVDGIANVTTLTINAGAVPVTHDATELPIKGTFSAVEG